YGVPGDGIDPAALWGPRDITLDNAGNVLVADTGGKRIRVYTSDGEWLRDIGSGGANLGELDEPVGVAVNPINGDVYVADMWNRRIQVFTPDGVALRAWEVPMWYDPERQSPDRPYLAVSQDGTLIAVSDMNATGRNDGPRIVVYDLAGIPVYAFNAPETDFAAGLYGVRIVAGMDFGSDGSLYVLDAESSRVVKFPPIPVTSGISPVPADGGAGAGGVSDGDDAESAGEFSGEAVGPSENLPFSLDEPFGENDSDSAPEADAEIIETEESESSDAAAE
ncbi:MAG TPA: NHL repeat-containing protein, partial [Aggregatilineales bacterium]|nr:NHL repeat-containing protein [Aggregatilineales bacterium]